jgi:hypothetical protein
MWSSTLNRSVRGYIMVVDAPHVALMEAYAMNIIAQELPFIEALLHLNKSVLEDVSKPRKPLNIVK